MPRAPPGGVPPAQACISSTSIPPVKCVRLPWAFRFSKPSKSLIWIAKSGRKRWPWELVMMDMPRSIQYESGTPSPSVSTSGSPSLPSSNARKAVGAKLGIRVPFWENPDKNGFEMSAASQGSLTESERFKYPSRFAVCDRPTRLGSDARPPTPIGSPLASASTFAPEPLKSRPLMITSEPASEAGSKSMVSPLIEVAGIRN